jgi:thiamine biosynthesis protein thiS
MKITANSKIFEVRENLKISDFISEQGFNPRRCVVELNGTAMKFSDFENLSLKDGDVLEIMQIVAGG